MALSGDKNFRWILTAAGLFITASTWAQNQGDVDALSRECEAARQQALAPIRAERTRTCIEQRLRTEEACKTYYTTYGNVGLTPTGAPSKGAFYDLPPCQNWLQAREALRQSHSRP